jgi:hypothetical protein
LWEGGGFRVQRPDHRKKRDAPNRTEHAAANHTDILHASLRLLFEFNALFEQLESFLIARGMSIGPR